jgi:hypothetical protein
MVRYTFPVRLFHPLHSSRFTGAFQDSLPTAGQALSDGTFTRRVPSQSFRALYISSSLPRLILAHSSPGEAPAGADCQNTCLVPSRGE